MEVHLILMGVLAAAEVQETIAAVSLEEVQVEAIPEVEERVEHQVQLNVQAVVDPIAHPLLIHLMLQVIDQDMVK